MTYLKRDIIPEFNIIIGTIRFDNPLQALTLTPNVEHYHAFWGIINDVFFHIQDTYKKRLIAALTNKKALSIKRNRHDYISLVDLMPGETITGGNQKKLADKICCSVRAMRNKAKGYFKENGRKVLISSSNGQWGIFEKDRDIFKLEKRGRKKGFK